MLVISINKDVLNVSIGKKRRILETISNFDLSLNNKIDALVNGKKESVLVIKIVKLIMINMKKQC